MAEKRLRTMELLLILALAFLPAFLNSLAFTAGVRVAGQARHIVSTVTFLSILAVLAYVLSRRKPLARRLSFAWTDLPIALGLDVAAFIAGLLFNGAYRAAFLALTGHRPDMANPALALFKSRLTAWYLLYIIVDPVFEELVMRAYTMTELEYLTGSTGAAVLGSTLLQASYHLYEGIGVVA